MKLLSVYSSILWIASHFTPAYSQSGLCKFFTWGLTWSPDCCCQSAFVLLLLLLFMMIMMLSISFESNIFLTASYFPCGENESHGSFVDTGCRCPRWILIFFIFRRSFHDTSSLPDIIIKLYIFMFAFIFFTWSMTINMSMAKYYFFSVSFYDNDILQYQTSQWIGQSGL